MSSECMAPNKSEVITTKLSFKSNISNDFHEILFECKFNIHDDPYCSATDQINTERMRLY